MPAQIFALPLWTAERLQPLVKDGAIYCVIVIAEVVIVLLVLPALSLM